MASYLRKVIADGVGYSTITDPKFKTNKIKVIFVTDLKEETAAANAMVRISVRPYQNRAIFRTFP